MHQKLRLKFDAASRVLVFDRTDPHPSPSARPTLYRLEALLARVEGVEQVQRESQREAREACIIIRHLDALTRLLLAGNPPLLTA
jgi:hypothetical protein